MDGKVLPEAAFVDLHQRSGFSGRFGAIDQIFPHELGHIILRLLAGPRKPGGANQIHAIGVRTDPGYALDEGFAEHFQILAIEDENAAPTTHALISAHERLRGARQSLNAYARELNSRWGPLAPRRMTFPLWFGQTEQALRYFGVKTNVFAREPHLARRLLTSDDPYAAYLLENTLPGDPDAAPKSVARLIATEGVVSALFYRWMSDARLGGIYREDEFYRRFGLERATVTPHENNYLKLFHVFHRHHPRDILEALEGYRTEFHDEAPRLMEIAQEIFLGQNAAAARPIWLANPDFPTGSSMFDQFRGLPRVHTFDLNAASPVDLVAVPGVSIELARVLMRAAPYESLQDLGRVAEMTPDLIGRFESMAAEMTRLRSDTAEGEHSLTIRGLLMPSIQRLLVWLLAAVVIGTCGYRFVTAAGWGRALLGGILASLVGLIGGWLPNGLAGGGSLLAIALVLSLPGGLWCLWRTGRKQETIRSLLAPLVAGLPIAVFGTPWG